MALPELDSAIFEAPVRPDLIQRVVVAQMAARRRGTAATKNRARVSGGGRKPYRQKGTGRARQGTNRSPQFAGGGVVFGPQPRSYDLRVPKRLRRAALRSALSLRKREGKLRQVDDLALSEPKTRHMVTALRELDFADVLIVTRERREGLERAARNLPTVRVLSVAGLNVRDIVAREALLLVGDAATAISERLG